MSDRHQLPGTVRQRHETALGLRTSVLEAGPADREEAVVFIHGHPGSSRDWADLVATVGEFARAVAFDLPGFGKADKPRDWDYGIGSYGIFTAALLDQLGVRRAHLVMHDLGGGAGLLWAASHPQQFASAVVIGTGVLIDYKWHPAAAAWRMPLIGEAIIATTNRRTFHALMRRLNPRLPEWFIEQLWEDYDFASRRAALKMYRASPPTGFERLADVFRPLDRPALALWGRHDPFVPAVQAQRQRRSFPRAEVVLLDAGHWAWIEQPDSARQHITAFLQPIVGGAAGGHQ